MRRRHAICWAAILSLAMLPISVAIGQSSTKTFVIGLLDAGDRIEWWDAFRNRLRELGYIEGRNVRFEPRYAGGNLDALPAMAQELVQINVTAIVTSGVAAASAARRATSKIPIIMASGTDQVSMGLVASLARPGGNVTGVSSLTSELAVKRFELLQELLPKNSLLGVLWHADNPASMASVRDLEGSATRARTAFKSFGVRSIDELDHAFAAMTRERIQGIEVVNSPFTYSTRKQIVELALKYKMPAVYGAAEYADAGGLLSYAPSYPELFRHAADYLDKVLKGSNPADMPIDQPTTFELVINASTARALGLAVPPSMLARANRVIQ
jgi:putative ABC transport system substrate-binding protein